jgi:hypothetical protein
VEGSLQRSQVCRSQDEVLDTADQWKAAMLEKGWTVTASASSTTARRLPSTDL